MTIECHYLNISTTARRIDLRRFENLNPESQRLVRGWFERAYGLRNDENECFEAFIFSWFAVNGWAACVTGLDRDTYYVKELQRSNELAARFKALLSSDLEFSETAIKFHSSWPIFKAQILRRAGHQAPANDRTVVVKHYLDQGIENYEPECWKSHADAGEAVPLDWAHAVAAIYRVRCNLFHGEKSAHSEMDKAIVR